MSEWLANDGEAILLRGLQSGDLGWVVQRNGEIYAEEFGWTLEYEALVARIVAAFVEDFAPELERAWIAELDGQRVGAIFCRRSDAQTAQLRLLVVDPLVRGQGLGNRLVSEVIDFARSAGYQRIVLWTNDVLVAARRIYERAGFELVDAAPHHSFGHDLIGQNWELRLT